MRRRTFLKAGLGTLVAAAAGAPAAATESGRPPNILWISAEDISPDLGCYGDQYASTPHLDAFARTAMRYDRAYSHSGVCAPTRSGIITGMYPTTIGTHHMRCSGIPPAGVKCFPEYLREAGYFCTNNVKTDYQFAPPLSAWDRNDRNAHWKDRNNGQPFFSVFNLTICHESQVRSRDPERLRQIEALGPRKHDPADAPVPPYHADTPATRKDWAQYYDVVSLMDAQAGRILEELKADGLAEDTIVWFWGDHGRGLTRGKRWLYESGTRIPLLIHVPEKYRKWVRPDAPETLTPGANDDLVSFIDFAPTMLSLAGVPVPAHLQGQAFLGRAEAPPREYVYGARDRMDEAYDIIRTVRDKQFRYFRNYMSYVTYAQHINYMDEMPMLQDLRRLHAEGKLNADQEKWFAPRKPLEELYDLEGDPHELNNLAGDPAYAGVLKRMRAAHEAWMASTNDVGLIPEPLLDALKWPDGTTAQCAPVIVGRSEGTQSMSCATPGSSISYQWDDAPTWHWRLYTGPVPLRNGRSMVARASRIGFRDSEETRVEPNSSAIPEAVPTAPPAFWGDVIGHGTLLADLRALRARDAEADASVGIYAAALTHAEPAMRYWAVVALHQLCESGPGDDRRKAAVRPLLSDPEAVVRVAAAHAWCAWGAPEEGLPVLEAVLRGGTQAERLYAAVALNALGDAARPAWPALELALDDDWEYVSRVAEEALRARDAMKTVSVPSDS